MPSCSLHAPQFSLRHSLECGQFFRWTEQDGLYAILRGQRFFRARQEGETLRYDGADLWFLREFLGLDQDYGSIEKALRRDRRLWEALDAYPGLRILRQDPWECTAAFITSIASNIPRITGNIADMARAYGMPIRLGSVESHTFPRPERLDDEAALRRLKLGFRASYLVQAARLSRSGILDEIAGQAYDDAKATLMVIPGVAEKVADCVLLFAYGRLNAFPVDTWIRKVMIRMFFKGRRVPDRAIRAFASERWGDLAGVAQQYLYHWSRRSGEFTSRRASTRPAEPAESKWKRSVLPRHHPFEWLV
ncbi:MAG: DNA-3-methyladenine glycosylase 2 [Planctomycetes bacterium]|nr:DNA-3-methyladenine glycosylase 2 [Planctomycetota bacterium]